VAVVREMSVVYAGQAIPGSRAGADLHLTGIHRIRKGPVDATVVFRFVVQASSESILAAACVSLEELFTRRREALRVNLLSSEALELSDADATGFDVTPEIVKVGESDPRFDTNTSRLYEVTIQAGIPARTVDDDFLQDFEYDVVYTPSRRGGLTVRGAYTADPGLPVVKASAVYLSEITARVATIIAALGWSAELAVERYTPNVTDTTVEFERSYRQVFFNQDAGQLDNPGIVDPSLIVKVVDEGTDGDPSARPLKRIVAEYTAAVDQTVEEDMVSLFDTAILPWITQNMETVAGGSVILETVEPGYNFDEHTIQATLTGLGTAGGSLLERKVEFTDSIDFGKIIRYTWPEIVPDDETDDEPNPTEAFKYQANRKLNRQVITTTTTLGDIASPALGGAGGVRGSPRIVLREGQGATVLGELATPTTEAGTEAVRLSRRSRNQPGFRGIQGTQQLVTIKTVTEEFEIIAASAQGSGGSTNQPKTRTRGQSR